MFPTTVLATLSPVLFASPLNSVLENACKEASKELQKKAKSVEQKKFTKKVVEDVLCAQAAKADKTITKTLTGFLKKHLDKQKKNVEKELAKKDPSSPQAVKLTGLRDDMLKAQKERDALLSGKPVKLPKPKGGGVHIPLKVRVLTKDKVEVDVFGFIGVDFKDIPKGKMPLNYGVLGLSGRF